MMTRLYLSAALTCLTFISCAARAADVPEANYDEAKIPPYTLPELLKNADGTSVSAAEAWRQQRRPEILRLFREQMFGRSPGWPEKVSYEVLRTDDSALGGKAVCREVAIRLEQAGRSHAINVLLYTPQNRPQAPAFLGLNFNGNHAVQDDPAITLNRGWFRDNKEKGYINNRATEQSRGAEQSRWPVEMIIDRGYAVATAYYGDIDPDFDDGFNNGVHALFGGAGARTGDAWGSIAAWAWGLSRILDYLETDPAIDARRVAVIGHSRLGKTSLWAGAEDERFALVISNDSGCGGAALSRRAIGETVARINQSFPHWFCANFHAYGNRENDLPIDQHMLIALMAPRPVYVASAVEDRWADPRGEFLSARLAGPAYALFGQPGLESAAGKPASDAMPAVDQPLSTGAIGYHIRTGKHDVTDYDWQQYLNFADRHLSKRP